MSLMSVMYLACSWHVLYSVLYSLTHKNSTSTSGVAMLLLYIIRSADVICMRGSLTGLLMARDIMGILIMGDM